jgi:hypothetical protein
MSGQHSVSIVARIGGFLILWLCKVPVACFGAVKMMASTTGQPVVGVDERLATVPDGAAKFKHARIVLPDGNIKRCQVEFATRCVVTSKVEVQEFKFESKFSGTIS